MGAGGAAAHRGAGEDVDPWPRSVDGKLERPWGSAPRHNSLVFIGRKLDHKEIEAGFESCVA